MSSPEQVSMLGSPASNTHASNVSLFDIVSSWSDLSQLGNLIRLDAEVASMFHGKNTMTVLAPSDAAFAKLQHGVREHLHTDPTSRTKVLKHHIIPGIRQAEDFVDDETVQTLCNCRLSVRVWQRTVVFSCAECCWKAALTGPNGRASNGIIHVIDTVCMDPATCAPPFDRGNSHIQDVFANFQPEIAAKAPWPRTTPFGREDPVVQSGLSNIDPLSSQLALPQTSSIKDQTHDDGPIQTQAQTMPHDANRAARTRLARIVVGVSAAGAAASLPAGMIGFIVWLNVSHPSPLVGVFIALAFTALAGFAIWFSPEWIHSLNTAVQRACAWEACCGGRRSVDYQDKSSSSKASADVVIWTYLAKGYVISIAFAGLVPVSVYYLNAGSPSSLAPAIIASSVLGGAVILVLVAWCRGTGPTTLAMSQNASGAEPAAVAESAVAHDGTPRVVEPPGRSDGQHLLEYTASRHGDTGTPDDVICGNRNASMQSARESLERGAADAGLHIPSTGPRSASTFSGYAVEPPCNQPTGPEQISSSGPGHAAPALGRGLSRNADVGAGDMTMVQLKPDDGHKSDAVVKDNGNHP